MTVWRALAPAKINLGLFVGPVRTDGRHQLVTVMQSISLADELTLSDAQGQLADDELHCPGVEGPPTDNLALRALVAFRAQSRWSAPPKRLSVEKRVPIAGGLGGGSGDAGAALRLAAAASQSGDAAMLHRIAVTLGADVPAQVQPGRWLASGAGEVLKHLPAPSQPLGVLVLPSQATLSTAAVYAAFEEIGVSRDAAQLERLEQELAAVLRDGAPLPAPHLLHNDLQRAARRLCPSIGQALSEATRAGADVALLSGSGPTVVGLFAGGQALTRAQTAARRLSGRTPAAVCALTVDAAFGAPSRLDQ